MDNQRGVFVAVDGPKHTGKTTVLDRAVRLLEAGGLTVLRTKEPTAWFDLSNEEHRTGADLARLLAADRTTHLERVIVPALASHDAVITDRYIGSSLSFQVLDGVPFKDVWAMNSGFMLPDLNIFVTADKASIRRRLAARGTPTRFDRQQRVAEEIAQYATVARFFIRQGVEVVELPNRDDDDMDQTAARMTAAIIGCIRWPG